MTDLDAVITAVDQTIAEARAYLQGAKSTDGRTISAVEVPAVSTGIGIFQTFRDKLIAAQKESYGG